MMLQRCVSLTDTLFCEYNICTFLVRDAILRLDSIFSRAKLTNFFSLSVDKCILGVNLLGLAGLGRALL